MAAIRANEAASAGSCAGTRARAQDGCGQSEGLLVGCLMTAWPYTLTAEQAAGQTPTRLRGAFLPPRVGVHVAEQVSQGDIVQRVRPALADFHHVMDARRAGVGRPELPRHGAEADRAFPAVPVTDVFERVPVARSGLPHALAAAPVLSPPDGTAAFEALLFAAQPGPCLRVEHVEDPRWPAGHLDYWALACRLPPHGYHFKGAEIRRRVFVHRASVHPRQPPRIRAGRR